MLVKKGCNGARILVISDFQILGAPLSDLLIHEGYQISIAFSGKDGLDLLNTNPHALDLIILDNVFLVSSWFYLLSKLSSIPIIKKIPSIMLIDQTESFYVNKAMKHAAYDILYKPVEDEVLLRVINSALETKENIWL